jgi:hypothetical protein
LSPGIEKIKTGNEESWEWYLYNNYLIEVDKCVKYFQYEFLDEEYYKSYVYVELSGRCSNPVMKVNGVDWCNTGLVAKGNKKAVFLAACKKVDDIILANEGF